MAQLDDDIGIVMQKLKDMGVDDNTIVVFTTDNGTEVFTWPDGGQTPFAQSKGTVMEGGFRAPAMIRWLGEKSKVDVPYLTNLRLDPFERTGWPENGTKSGSQEYFGWFKYEFWRFVFVQQEVEKLAMTAVEFPPMQKGASFNLDAVKAKIEAARASVAK